MEFFDFLRETVFSYHHGRVSKMEVNGKTVYGIGITSVADLLDFYNYVTLDCSYYVDTTELDMWIFGKNGKTYTVFINR